MRIIDLFNKILISNLKRKNSILFGQNITTGSRISGMTNNIEKLKECKIINMPNSENSLIGYGCGVRINNKSCIYFVKQLDFVLLGMDHIVNTINMSLIKGSLGNFKIITYIVDSGYEGPQSRLHNLGEIQSLSKINSRYLVFKDDIETSFKISKNGLTILCLSQKYSRFNFDIKKINKTSNDDIFHYWSGKDITVLGIGFSGYKILNDIKKNKIKNADFFLIVNPNSTKLNYFYKSLKKTKKLILFDDSKSEISYLEKIKFQVKSKMPNVKIFSNFNKDSIKKLYPNKDSY